jgi:hypothetical protein
MRSRIFCGAAGTWIWMLVLHCVHGATDATVVERFQGQALERLDTRGGEWNVKREVEMYDLVERNIYQSPEEPSHTAWVGMWRQKDGGIYVSFSRVMGDPGMEPSYHPTYGRSGEERWQKFAAQHGMRPGPAAAATSTTLDSPTLVTRDAGETWEDLGLEHEPRGGNLRFVCARDGSLVNKGLATVLCHDGRIVSTANPQEWMKDVERHIYFTDQALIAVRESLDDGKTWSPLQFINPTGSDPELIKTSGEETALVEMADGRLLALIRCDPGGPVQTYLTRVGPGTYEGTPPTRCGIPHGGLPDLVRGSDGVVWYWGLEGHWYSEDDGASWHPAPVQLRSYYGKMLESTPGQLLCVTQSLIHDSPYPFWQDGAIRMSRFRWRRSGTLEQTSDAVRFARAVTKGESRRDMHVRARVRVDGINGIIFHVSDDGGSYYFLGVVTQGHPLYKEYFPPELQDEKLAANYAGAEQFGFALGRPMVVLARIEGEKITLLRGIRLLQISPSYYVKAGTWAQMQVKVSGDLIQGAVQLQDERFPWATFVGAHDAALPAGRVGVFSDRSTGAFKDLEVWDRPQMIRDLWRTEEQREDK